MEECLCFPSPGGGKLCHFVEKMFLIAKTQGMSSDVN